MSNPESEKKSRGKKQKVKIIDLPDNTHLGSSNAFEETENPLSRDADDISDEKLDEMIGE